MHGSAPVYLSELREQSCVEGRTRSSARGDLVVQRTRTKFGEHAFFVAGTAAWNQLPCSIRNSSSVNSFKTALKTFTVHAKLDLSQFHCCMQRSWRVQQRIYRLNSAYTISYMQRIFSIGLRFVRRSQCYGALEIVVTLLYCYFYYCGYADVRKCKMRILMRVNIRILRTHTDTHT